MNPFLERSIEAYYYDEHHAAAEELAHLEAGMVINPNILSKVFFIAKFFLRDY